MASSIEIKVAADIAQFKSGMDKAAMEGKKLNKKLSKSFKAIGNVMRSVGTLAGIAVAGGLGSMAMKFTSAWPPPAVHPGAHDAGAASGAGFPG